MEKYLKIHWLIKIILGFTLFISILLIMQSIYWLIFYKWIQETITILGSKTREYITIPIILFWFTIQLLIIIIIYNVLNYKRWAILIIFILIGLPLSVIFLWMIWFIIFQLFNHGVKSIEWDEILFSLICTISALLNWFSIKTNIEFIRLYRNIKNVEQIEESKFQDQKPKFLNIFLVSIFPIIILWWLMIALYKPVVPLDLPDWYFKMDGFDFDNPTYTDQKICKNFESEIWKMNETVRHINKEDINSWVILAKAVLFSYQTNAQIKLKLNAYITDDRREKEKVEKMRKITELETYIQNYPEQWNEALSILRSQLTTESVMQLQKLTHWLPQNINCNIRNDQNITEESFPRLTQYLITSRLYDAAIKLTLLENNKERTIELLKSFHEFNAKFYNSNISLAKGMIGNTLLDIEFWTVEYVIEHTNTEQIEKIREIYDIPYNIKENQINSWKWEYYFLEHILTGREKSIKQVSIPYFFNWEDMLNRAIILHYAWAIAEVQNDTNLLQDIKENKKLNNNNFLTPTEASFIEEWISNWRGSNIFFARFYNPIGKVFIESLIPSYTSYAKRYNSIGLYQDYIRYNLLWIGKK